MFPDDKIIVSECTVSLFAVVFIVIVEGLAE
jgi:hypothetical protein